MLFSILIIFLAAMKMIRLSDNVRLAVGVLITAVLVLNRHLLAQLEPIVGAVASVIAIVAVVGTTISVVRTLGTTNYD